jgi:hypothetical protein
VLATSLLMSPIVYLLVFVVELHLDLDSYPDLHLAKSLYPVSLQSFPHDVEKSLFQFFNLFFVYDILFLCSWNMVKLCFLMLVRGKHVSCTGEYITFQTNHYFLCITIWIRTFKR